MDPRNAVVNAVTIFCKEDHQCQVSKRVDHRGFDQIPLLGEPGNRSSSMGFGVLIHDIRARLATIASNVHENSL